MNLDKQKVVIRLFLQTIYRKCLLLLFFDSDKILMRVLSGNFTFNPTAKVPWNAISKEPGRYLAEGSLPTGVNFVEPSKLRADDVATLWCYWRESQKTNERPVYFIEAVAKDIRPHGDGGKWPKRKMESKVRVSGKKDKGKGKAKAAQMSSHHEVRAGMRSPLVVELAAGMGGVKSLYTQQIEDLAGQLRRELGVGA